MQTSQLKIIAAVGIGLVMVGLAYFSSLAKNAPGQNAGLVATAPAPARTFISTSDTDADGTPDWQSSLVRTIPLAVATTTNTGPRQPETLTEAFGIAFFEQYLTNQTYGSLGTSDEELIERSTAALVNNLPDNLIGPSGVTISADTSLEAVKAYGNEFASIIFKYPSERDAEMVILERALKNNNPQELEKLRPILNDYRAMLVDMKLLPVPQTYVKEHLDIINSMQAIAFDIEAMLLVFDDPVLTLVRIKRYENDVYGMTMAIINLFGKMVEQDNIIFTSNDPFGKFMGVPSN
jgi:hypothetical protein